MKQRFVENPVQPGNASQIWRNLRAALLATITRQWHVRQFQEKYGRVLTRISGIEHFTVTDTGSYLEVYTHYSGDLEDLEDQVYELEADMMRAFPDVRPNWHLVKSQRQNVPSSEKYVSETAVAL